MKCREYNYDKLRTVCCLSVILQHIASLYTENVGQIFTYPRYYFAFADFLQMITRFAVPCFVMLSGAFVLEKYDGNVLSFYLKSIKKIVIPTVVFSLIYILYRLFTKATFKQILLDTLRGVPTGHMWYMYMIIGMYAIIPLVSIIIRKCSTKHIIILNILLIIVGICCHFMLKLIWPFQWIEYLGYLVTGYNIKKNIGQIQVNRRMSLWFAMFIYLFIYLLNEYSLYQGEYIPSLYRHPNFPLVVIGSICFFYYFAKSEMKIRKIVTIISAKSFTIYMCHPLIYASIHWIVIRVFNRMPNPIWYIPILFIVTTLVSIVFSIFYDKLSNRILYKEK